MRIHLVRRLAAPALAGFLLCSGLAAGPASAAAGSGTPAVPAKAAPSSSTASQLTQAFETSQRVPGSAIGGIRSGTLRTGTAGGHQWATAGFAPAKSATQQQSVAFQDGAASGVFEKTGGTWHLVRSGPDACGTGLPASLKTAWHVTAPASLCGTPVSSQRAAASKSRSALLKAAGSAAGQSGIGQKIAATALSQVGVQTNPPVSNFNGVDCDPYSTMDAGFSANSNGCGYDSAYNVRNENETWCSDFAKWVWERNGITDDVNTLNAGAVSYYQWATAHGQSPQPDTGTPQVGDSVLFFGKSSFPSFADHVGIVTAVHPDGSIDMVNGDFDGGPTVAVEYDQDITNLAAFAQQAEGDSSEEWVLVSPPSAAQAPAPTGQLTAPSTAVAGSTGAFHASGTVQGSSVSAYYWTFGDDRTTNASGPDVTHAFTEPGTYTVSVTITSAAGTSVTLHKNVQVLAPSAAVASAPTDVVWYDARPVDQYTFTRSGNGLSEDAWNGGSWLRSSVPGTPSATGNITTLSYPDDRNADSMTPHAFYRDAGGSLAETRQASSGWVSEKLPGTPVAGGSIVATNTGSVSGDPEVFFLDGKGNLDETSQSAGSWATRTVVAAADSPALTPSSLSLTDTTSGPVLFADGPDGTIRVASQAGGNWSERGLPAKTAAGAPLTATTTPGGAPAVFYADSGTLKEASGQPAGKWTVANLPGSPASGTTLAATTYLLPSQIPATPGDFPAAYGSLTDSSTAEPLGTEAFYLTASGAPAVSYDDGTGWKTASVPAVSGAKSIAGVTAFGFEEEPTNLFLSGPGGLSEETTGARSGDPSGGSWTATALPGTDSTWPDRVVLYAADPSDAAAAQSAAKSAGLPATSVTTSFSQAWADALDGGVYLVYTVGGPATRALYSNVCGWPNPSGLPAGGTPFSYYTGQRDTPPGPGYYVDADSDTAADTQTLATDDAYYALHGTLPPGVTSAPAAVSPPAGCSGSPS